jgi:hypothetical protein
MAFTSTINNNGASDIAGTKRIVTGTFENTSGTAGGDIATGLRRVEFFSAQHTGSAVVASAPVANETFPLSSGVVTIVTVADADGIWFAYGE